MQRDPIDDDPAEWQRRSIDEIANVGRRTRRQLKRSEIVLGAIIGVLGMIFFVRMLLVDPDSSGSSPSIDPSPPSFATGLLVGLAVGVVVGLAVGRRRK
jgi:hypothetical protein